MGIDDQVIAIYLLNCVFVYLCATGKEINTAKGGQLSGLLIYVDSLLPPNINPGCQLSSMFSAVR